MTWTGQGLGHERAFSEVTIKTNPIREDKTSLLTFQIITKFPLVLENLEEGSMIFVQTIN